MVVTNSVLRAIGIGLLALGLASALLRLLTIAIIPAVSPFLVIIAFILLALVGGAIYDWARNRHAPQNSEDFANFQLEFLEQDEAQEHPGQPADEGGAATDAQTHKTA